MGIMWLCLNNFLRSQRADVFYHLYFSSHIPLGEEDNPMSSVFTVYNGSDYEISANNMIGCEVILAVGNHGAGFVQNIGRPAYANPDSGHVEISRSGEHPHVGRGSPLKAGNDAESAKCLSWFGFDSGAECIDVKIVFWYSLQEQPSIPQEKNVRYVTAKGKDGRFFWLQKPSDAMQSYCMSSYSGH
jgi:hypothetical protein